MSITPKICICKIGHTSNPFYYQLAVFISWVALMVGSLPLLLITLIADQTVLAGAAVNSFLLALSLCLVLGGDTLSSSKQITTNSIAFRNFIAFSLQGIGRLPIFADRNYSAFGSSCVIPVALLNLTSVRSIDKGTVFLFKHGQQPCYP